jgi:uroporphyrinogen-III synthase
MRLLVTRPEGEGERTAAALRLRGHEVWLAPLLRIEAIEDAELGAGPWQAVLFTSTNAIRAIAGHRRLDELKGLPAYGVGNRSAKAAAAAGFTPVHSADGDIDALVALVAAKVQDTRRPLIYLAGEQRTGDLAGALATRGLTVETAVVYRGVMVTRFPPRVETLLATGEIDAVLHYSTRSAQAFLGALAATGGADLSIKIKHLCLSSQVAAPLLAAGVYAVEVAAEPNESALFECIDRA